MDIGMRSLHPAAADHSVSIRGSRCTAWIMLSLRSRAGDPDAQRWYSNCGDGTWHLRSLLRVTRVTYVTKTFPFSRSLRVTSDDRLNRDPYQSAKEAAPSSALCRPPDPSYKADDRTGLHREGQLLLSLKHPKPFRLEEAHCGVTSSQKGLSDINLREVTP